MKLSQRSNGLWQVEYTDDAGKRIRKSTGTRDFVEAKRKARIILSGEDDHGPTSHLFTVGDALDAAWENVWKHSKSGEKKLSEVRIVRARWGKEPIEGPNYGNVQEWVNAMRRAGLAPATINNKVSVLSRALEEAGRIGKLKDVPKLPRLPVRNKRDRFLTEAEETALKAETAVLNTPTPRPQGGGQVRLEGSGDVMRHLIDVLIYTGMRLSEVIRSKPSDRTGDILFLYDTKGGKSVETVYLLPDAITSLEALWEHPTWLQVTDDAGTSEKRMASARDWCVKRFTILRNRLGLHDVSLHILRHTTASRLVQRGVSLDKVKEILRHSTVQVTERYAHLTVDHLKDDMAKLVRKPSEVSQDNVIKLRGRGR